MKKYNISAVSYLNTRPFLAGLVNSSLNDRINLTLETPAGCADNLITGKADIALAPVATLLQLENYRIISDYCIGSDSEVQTVCIYSRKPLEKANAIYLDYQSRTSVELAKILLKEYWKISPELIYARPGFEQQIDGNIAGLIIGERVITGNLDFPYAYDLGKAWKMHTSLPFVYAAWIAVEPIEPEFANAFNEALGSGIDQIRTLSAAFQNEYPPDFNVYMYLTKNISYDLNADKKKALELFLQKAAQSE